MNVLWDGAQEFGGIDFDIVLNQLPSIVSDRIDLWIRRTVILWEFPLLCSDVE